MQELKCPVCQKTLTNPPGGRVTRHAGRDGNLCRGVGRYAIEVVRASKGRGQVRSNAKVTARKKAPRPQLGLPSPRPAKPSPKDPKPSETREDRKQRQAREYWSLFGDVLRRDLDDDAGWRRVRLGPSQGAGKRR